MTRPRPNSHRSRRAPAAAVLLAALVLLAACGGSSEESTTTTVAEADTQSLNIGQPRDEGDPVPGGTLTVALPTDVNGFDPTTDAFGISATTVAQSIFDPLAVVAPDGTIVPYLAESFTPNADFTSWTIQLREGVTFSDGTPVDAAAVAGHLQRGIDSPTVGRAARGVSAVTASGPLSVTVDVDAPWAQFPSSLTTQLGLVGAPAMYASEDPSSNPIGSGPFTLTDWRPGDRTLVTARDDYWIEDRPWLDEVEFRVVPNPTSRVATLGEAEVDMILAEDAGVVGRTEQLDGVRVDAYPGALVQSVVLNTASGPAADPEVRRALALATDQDLLAEIVTSGNAAPARSIWGPASIWTVDDEAYPRPAVEEAVEAVSRIERRTGQPLEIAITVGNSTGRSIAEVLADQWGQAGIDVEVVNVDGTTATLALVNGDFDAYISGRFGRPEPDMEYTFLHSKFIGEPGAFSTNLARFGNDAIDAALDRARASADPEERQASLQVVSDELADALPYLYIWYEVIGVGALDAVGGQSRVTLPDGQEAAVFNGQFFVGDIWVDR